MARRVQALAALVVERYDGDAAALWRDVPDGAALLRRLKALPGFGTQKAQIFVALLGKQRGVTPPGWREAAGAYGDDGSFRSVADVVDGASLGPRPRVQAGREGREEGGRGAADGGRAAGRAAVARWVVEGARAPVPGMRSGTRTGEERSCLNPQRSPRRLGPCSDHRRGTVVRGGSRGYASAGTP